MAVALSVRLTGTKGDEGGNMSFGGDDSVTHGGGKREMVRGREGDDAIQKRGTVRSNDEPLSLFPRRKDRRTVTSALYLMFKKRR